MDSDKWKGFGFDMARVNADIKRKTGKWGKLKTPEEVKKYLKTMEERVIEQTEAPADRAITSPPKPRKHGLRAARIVQMKDGNAVLSKVNEYGIATETLELKKIDSKANGRAYLCADCKERFPEWKDFIDHSLKNKE